MNREIRAALITSLLVLAGVPTSAFAADRHAGHYYPAPQTREEYQARSEILPDTDRRKRIDFVNGLTAQMLASPYPPQFSIFAKGDGAQKLIIVGFYDGGYNTLFRARALLAMLTAVSRLTPFFRDHNVDDTFTFFDLAFLLGFTQLTISDGRDFAHQITFE